MFLLVVHSFDPDTMCNLYVDLPQMENCLLGATIATVSWGMGILARACPRCWSPLTYRTRKWKRWLVALITPWLSLRMARYLLCHHLFVKRQKRRWDTFTIEWKQHIHQDVCISLVLDGWLKKPWSSHVPIRYYHTKQLIFNLKALKLIRLCVL